MACQYFFSNKKKGKTYRPFLDYLQDDNKKKVDVDIDDALSF